MLPIFTLGLAAVAGFAAAQKQPQNNYPYTIDPESVSESDRRTWCDNQRAQCPNICTQLPGVTSTTTIENDCDWEALTYSCVCENGKSPNITQYSQTLPYYICLAWGTQCVANCGPDNECASTCREDHPCGAQEPPKPNKTASSTVSSTTPTPSTTKGTSDIPVDGFGGDQSDNSNQPKGAAVMLNLGQGYGMAIVVGSVVAAFGYLL
ncbi:uncharacterized protein EI97DRAFT_367346 [Westerdykella ornata]|uniref:DUF7707 domain-containing protein n=1 Tax=Westerdykella ornata TaxID=318751 RepID=A0A6A6JXG3_WESOR|nr:uncharacterized protein EI97DRAFT_367346 [Westerdykella ornata]KAF2281311.1 hypothetical protein EI97DRAFT_367346 [Westerdykella ornata]